MTTFLLIVHGLLAVALLGAVTHQAVSVFLPARKAGDSFVGRMRAVSAPSYVTAIVVLYVATAILGGLIYPEYRLGVRVVLEQLDLRKANGSFELKEHFVAVGLGMLPAYWFFWRQPLAASYSERNVLPRQAEINVKGLAQVIAFMGEAGTVKQPLPAAERFVDLEYLRLAGIQ